MIRLLFFKRKYRHNLDHRINNNVILKNYLFFVSHNKFQVLFLNRTRNGEFTTF